jgi:transcriptional regulator GlxA family with amidase domain
MARVIIVTFPGAATLDVAGPAEVFAGVERAIGRPAYEVVIASVGGVSIESTSTLRFSTRDLRTIRPRPDDTVVVAGALEAPLRIAMTDAALLKWLRAATPKIARLASVCSGAFVLGAAGLLDGKRVATHWRGTRAFTDLFPRADLDPKAIFVRDGTLWTSAGVTTGIDMSLAIVEQDFGRATADAIAADLVLYLRRPGFQSQFSTELVAQRASTDPLGTAVEWVRSNLKKADVESFARSTGLSVRTLHRRCLEHLRTTPAKLIEKYRLEHARTLLETTTLPVKVLASECGFGSAAHLARAFERELGVAPREYRLLHGKAA